MGTRSRIGKTNKDGSVTSIYVHWDGYLDHVGRILANHYTTDEKVDGLVGLGDLSSLGEEIGTKHNFDTCPRNECNAYGRDRGEDGVEPVTHDMSEWPDSGWEYRYLWDSGAWLVSKGDDGFTDLREALERKGG